MARQIPEIVRAAAGLAATVLDEARKLPETLPGLPIRILGLAMQQAMRVQQQYAGLVARGDEVFTGLRGDDEPGLATFDDDEVVEQSPATANGLRNSAFDRTEESALVGTAYLDETAVDSLPADPAADAVTAAVDGLADQVETGERSIEDLVDEAPAIAEILDEIAIDELVDQAPTLEETAPSVAATLDAEPTADVATVDVLTPEGDIATVDATVTDEGIAAPEAPAAPAGDDATATDEGGTPVAVATADSAEANADPADATVDVPTPDGGVATVDATVTDEGIAAPEAPAAPAGDDSTATDESGTPVAAATGDAAGSSDPSGSPAPRSAPIDGYDSFSVAQLRGRLRGYALSTVQDLFAYEEATRARAPYLKMLRNRLEKLEEQAVESSPLAPRGA